MLQYGVIVALILVASVAVVASLGDNIALTFDFVNRRVAQSTVE